MDAMELFFRWRDDVYRLAVNYTRTPQEAEEVCQSVFRALPEQKRLLPGMEIGWLLERTAEECRSRLRRAWWRRLPSLNETIPLPVGLETPAARAVMCIEPEFRVVLYLRYYEEFTTEEIGKLLKLSVRTVTARLSRGRELFRAVLGEE